MVQAHSKRQYQAMQVQKQRMNIKLFNINALSRYRLLTSLLSWLVYTYSCTSILNGPEQHATKIDSGQASWFMGLQVIRSICFRHKTEHMISLSLLQLGSLLCFLSCIVRGTSVGLVSLLDFLLTRIGTMGLEEAHC